MVMNKRGGVSLAGIIIGFMALAVYAIGLLPMLDSALDLIVPELTGMTKWVVQLFPAAFLVAIIFYVFKDDESY